MFSFPRIIESSFPRIIESHLIYKQNKIKLLVGWMSSSTIFNTSSTANHPTSESFLTANFYHNKKKLPIHLTIDEVSKATNISNSINIACISSAKAHTCADNRLTISSTGQSKDFQFGHNCKTYLS